MKNHSTRLRTESKFLAFSRPDQSFDLKLRLRDITRLTVEEEIEVSAAEYEVDTEKMRKVSPELAILARLNLAVGDSAFTFTVSKDDASPLMRGVHEHLRKITGGRPVSGAGLFDFHINCCSGFPVEAI
ncbi:MAG: hypothetical protein WKF34_07105 [Pyrinomonadaceae bacterium]